MSGTPPEAFVSLARAQQDSLLRAGRLLTGDWEAAEELLRKTLAWALANWDVIEDAQMPAALAVRQRIIELYLAEQRIEEDYEQDEDEDEEGGAVGPAGVPDAGPGPAGRQEATGLAGPGPGTGLSGEGLGEWHDEETATIHGPLPPASFLETLAVLTPESRGIVVARYYLSLSAAEIGTVADIDAEDVDEAAVSILAALRRGVAHVGGEG